MDTETHMRWLAQRIFEAYIVSNIAHFDIEEDSASNSMQVTITVPLDPDVHEVRPEIGEAIKHVVGIVESLWASARVLQAFGCQVTPRFTQSGDIHFYAPQGSHVGCFAPFLAWGEEESAGRA
jgi:hypothetical protein